MRHECNLKPSETNKNERIKFLWHQFKFLYQLNEAKNYKIVK